MDRGSVFRLARRVRVWAAVLSVGLVAMAASIVVAAPMSPPSTKTMQAAPVVNSRDFPSIQAAIDGVKDSGGTVFIPAGTHVLPAKVRVYSNVAVVGAGMDATILRFADGVADHMMANSSVSGGNANIVIRDLTLAGSGPGARDCCFGLRLVNVRDSAIVNVASDGFSKDGFYLGYYRQLGVYNVRLSGCRATSNGRNGISLTHGSGNIVDNCRVENNNRAERVAGIDLEPDEGQDVSSNRVVGNVASNQNVGVQLFAFDRAKVTLANNVVCTNTATRNTSAGIYDLHGNANIFVNNSTEGNGTNFRADPSARLGAGLAGACQLPPVPARPPTVVTPPPPTPTPSPAPGAPPATGAAPSAGPTPTTPIANAPLCFGVPATIVGSGRIVGTEGDDVIVGSGGNDEILGLGGNDRICGKNGNDRIDGGPGDDQIKGGPGDDTLAGGDGNDLVKGGKGTDVVAGGTGDDLLRGGEGDDALDGGLGVDACSGGLGTNTATACEVTD